MSYHYCKSLVIVKLKQVNEAMPMRDPEDAIRVRLVICQKIPMACKHLFPDLRRRTRTRPKLGWSQKHDEGNAKISKRVEEKISWRPSRTYQSVSQFLFELKNCIVQSLPLKKLILCTLLKQDKL